MLLDHCPVCDMYRGQMVGWIKMRLGVQVGLSSGHIVLDGDPAPPQKEAQQPPLSKFTGCVHIICSPCLLWPNGWMDQDATW